MKIFTRIGIIATITVFGTITYQYFFWGRTLTISDVARPSVVSLMTEGQNSTSIRVEITGTIEGESLLEWNCRPDTAACALQEKIGPGKVAKQLGGDWYSPNFVLKYTPLASGVRSGTLQIRYRF